MGEGSRTVSDSVLQKLVDKANVRALWRRRRRRAGKSVPPLADENDPEGIALAEELLAKDEKLRLEQELLDRQREPAVDDVHVPGGRPSAIRSEAPVNAAPSGAA